MKDFTNANEALLFLEDINIAAMDAVINDDNDALNQAINELEESGLYKTTLGKTVIDFNNIAGTITPFSSPIENHIYNKLSKDERAYFDETLRKTFLRHRDAKETTLAFLIAQGSVNNSKEAILAEYNKRSEIENTQYQENKKQQQKYGNADFDLKQEAIKKRRDTFNTQKMLREHIAYIDAIEQALGSNSSTFDFLPLDPALLDTYKYYDYSKSHIDSLSKLCKMRKNFIISYLEDVASVFGDEDSLPSIDSMIDTINQFINDGDFENDIPSFLLNTSSFDPEFKDERYTVNQYLVEKCEFSKNTPGNWINGIHNDGTYVTNKRKIALCIFLYLGIPYDYMDSFFKYFGMAFGYGTDVIPCNINGTIKYLSESYIRYLISIGLSYDVICALLPKGTKRNISKK